MTDRNMVRVNIVSQHKGERRPFDFGGEYTPGSLNKVIDSLLAIKASIPEEYRDAASCEIDSDDGLASIYVAYERPETEDESADRLRREAVVSKRVELQEREMFERLKAKFGG